MKTTRYDLVILDHLEYQRTRPYRREVHAKLRRLVNEFRGQVSAVQVVHEADDSCCEREPWHETYIRLVQALNDDGLRTLGVEVREE